MRENSSIQDASLILQNCNQDLGKGHATQEEINQNDKISEIEPGQSEGDVSDPLEHDQQSINEKDSKYSIDNMQSLNSEVSDKDESISQPNPSLNDDTFESIQVTEKTFRSPVNKPDSGAKDSESPDTSQNEGSEQAEGNQPSSASDNAFINVPFIEQGDISDTLTTIKIESRFANDSDIVQNNEKENNTTTDSEGVDYIVTDNERGSLVIDSQDHENGDMTENSSNQDSSLMIENRIQDLGKGHVTQEEINQNDKISEIEPGQSEGDVRFPLEHDQQSINEEYSTSSLDNMQSLNSEVSDKDESISQSNLSLKDETLESIQVTEKTFRSPVNIPDSDSKESESPDTSQNEGSKQAEGHQPSSTSDNKLINVPFIEQGDISDTLTTIKIESRFANDSDIVQNNEKENNTTTDSEGVENSVTDNERGSLVIDSQDHENGDMTENSSIQDSSMMIENRIQDLGKGHATLEEMNENDKISEIEPGQSEGDVRFPLEHDQQSINEEYSTSSLDNMQSLNSEVSDKDESISQSNLSLKDETLESIQVTEKTFRSPVNIPDSDSKESESPDTSQNEGSKQAEGNQPSSTSDNKLINVPFIEQGDISDTLTTIKIESRFANDSDIVQNNEKENNTTTDSEGVDHSVTDNERGSLVIDSQDHENGDMTENSSIQDSSLMIENRIQDLGKEHAIQEEMNQNDKISEIEPGQLEGDVSDPLEHDQQSINEKNSISSLDNMQSLNSEVSDKDERISQPNLSLNDDTFESIQVTEKTFRSPVNKPDSDSKDSESPDTSQNEGSKQAEGNQPSSTNDNTFINVPFIEQGDISDTLTTIKIESRFANDSDIVQNNKKENNTTTDSEGVDHSVTDNERGSLVIDSQDHENGDMTENSSIQDSSLMIEIRIQDLGKGHATLEEMNENDKISEIEPGQSEGDVSDPLEHDQQSINEDDSTSSLDNMQSLNSEVSDKDESISQSNLSLNDESFESIQVTEKTFSSPVNKPDSDSKESETPDTSQNEGSKQAERHQPSSSRDNKLINVPFIEQGDISDTLTTIKIESRFANDSDIVQNNEIENNTTTDSEGVDHSVTDNDRGSLVIDSQDHENGDMTEMLSIQDSSLMIENHIQDLGKGHATQEEMNQNDKISEIEPGQLEGDVSDPLEHDQQSINEKDSISSLDNMQSLNSEVSDKDERISQPNLSLNDDTFESIQVTEKTFRSPVNKPDSDSKDSESPDTSQNEGSKQAEGNQPSSTNDNTFINVPFIEQGDISDTLTTIKIESRFANDSDIVQNNKKENNTTTDSEGVDHSVTDNERGSLVIDSQDHENGDMTEMLSIQDSSLMIEIRIQDLGKGHATLEEMNENDKISEIEPGQSEGDVSDPLEHDQQSINEDDSTSSLDNMQSLNSEVSDKDESISQSNLSLNDESFESIQVTEKTFRSPVNKPDSDSKESETPDTSQNEGSKQAERHQPSSSRDNKLINVPFIEQGDISDTLTTIKIESRFANDSDIVQNNEIENNTTTDSEGVDHSVTDNDRGSLVIDSQDHENGDMTEMLSIQDSSLMIENHIQDLGKGHATLEEMNENDKISEIEPGQSEGDVSDPLEHDQQSINEDDSTSSLDNMQSLNSEVSDKDESISQSNLSLNDESFESIQVTEKTFRSPVNKPDSDSKESETPDTSQNEDSKQAERHQPSSSRDNKLINVPFIEQGDISDTLTTIKIESRFANDSNIVQNNEIENNTTTDSEGVDHSVTDNDRGSLVIDSQDHENGDMTENLSIQDSSLMIENHIQDLGKGHATLEEMNENDKISEIEPGQSEGDVSDPLEHDQQSINEDDSTSSLDNMQSLNSEVSDKDESISQSNLSLNDESFESIQVTEKTFRSPVNKPDSDSKESETPDTSQNEDSKQAERHQPSSSRDNKLINVPFIEQGDISDTLTTIKIESRFANDSNIVQNNEIENNTTTDSEGVDHSVTDNDRGSLVIDSQDHENGDMTENLSIQDSSLMIENHIQDLGKGHATLEEMNENDKISEIEPGQSEGDVSDPLEHDQQSINEDDSTSSLDNMQSLNSEVSDKDESISQSNLSLNDESFESIQVTEKTFRSPVNKPDSDSKESETPDTSQNEDSKQAERHQPSSSRDNKLINVPFIEQGDISDTLTTIKIESRFANDSDIVQNNEIENNTTTDSEGVDHSVTDNDRGSLVIDSQDHENGDMTENLSIQDSSLMIENHIQDLGKGHATQEEMNQNDKISEIEPGQLEGDVSDPLEHDQQSINEKDSISSLDNMQSLNSEVSDKDESISQPNLSLNDGTFESIQVTEKTFRSPVNKPDSDSKESETPDTSQNDGSKQAEENQPSSTSDNTLINVPFIEQGDISDTLTTIKIECRFANDSDIVQNNEKENNTTTDSEGVDHSVTDNERGSLVIDLQDHENGDMTENSSIQDSSLMIENRIQDLGKGHETQEEMNENDIILEIEPGQLEGDVSDPLAHDQQSINEEDSTSSLDNMQSLNSEISDKDESISQPNLSLNDESFESIQVKEKTFRSPVNKLDSDSKESETPDISQNEGSKQAEGNQQYSTSGNKLINVSFIEQGDISDTLTTTKIESRFANDSGIVEDNEKENTTTTDSERVENSLADNERRSLMIDSQDHENGDMTENSSNQDAHLMIEKRIQDLGRRHEVQKEINQISKISKVDSRQSEGNVSTPFEHDQQSINEEDSTSSLDNMRSMVSEVYDKDESLSQSSIDQNVESFESIQVRETTSRPSISYTKTIKSECRFENDSGIVIDSDKENNTSTDSERVENSVANIERGSVMIDSQDLENTDMTENSSMQEVSQITENQELGRILAEQEEINQVNHISNDQETINKEDSTSSIDNIRPVDYEDSDKDVSHFSTNVGSFESIHVRENTCPLPVNAPDNNSKESQSPETCETKESKQAEGNQQSSTSDNELMNVSLIKKVDISEVMITAEFESWFENDSGVVPDKENNTIKDSERAENSVADNEQGSILIDLQDLQDFADGDMTENSFIQDTSLMTENHDQIEFDCHLTSTPMKCPIFRTKLGGAAVTECGQCICTHCFNQRKISSDQSCDSCDKAIDSHLIVEIEEISEDIIRSQYLKIEELEETGIELKHQVRKSQEELEHKEAENQRLRENGLELTHQVKKCLEELERKHTENQRLQESCIGFEHQIKKYQGEFEHKQNENQRLQDEWLATNEQTLQYYKALCIEQISKLQYYQDNVVPSKDIAIEKLRNEVAKLSKGNREQMQQIKKYQEKITHEQTENQRLQGDLFQTKHEVLRLSGEIENLTMFNTQCFEQANQLQNYYEQVVQSKDNAIEELRNEMATVSGCLHEKQEETVQLKRNNEELCGEVATLKRETVSVSQLEVLPGTNLSRAIQQLQHFYDRDFRIRYGITDKMEVLLQTRLESVKNELSQQPNIGDQLASVITTYVSMVQENANLHRCLRTNQDRVQDLQAQLRHTKARLISPKQTVQYR